MEFVSYAAAERIVGCSFNGQDLVGLRYEALR